MGIRAEYKKKMESRVPGILRGLNADASTRWAWWDATKRECYLVVFKNGVAEEIATKALEGMTRAFRAANAVRVPGDLQYAIAITPKGA